MNVEKYVAMTHFWCNTVEILGDFSGGQSIILNKNNAHLHLDTKQEKEDTKLWCIQLFEGQFEMDFGLHLAIRFLFRHSCRILKGDNLYIYKN